MNEHDAAIAWAIDTRRGRILLVNHPHFGWSCPGGHVEPDETHAAAAARELAEETGVRGDPIDAAPFLVGRNTGCPRSPGVIDVLHHFRFEVDSSVVPLGEPGQRAQWFDIAALPDPHVGDLDVGLALLRA